MQTYSYPESQALFQRASRVMPCGIYGHFSPAPLIPPEHYPFFTAKAKGARFFDIDGNEFVDYMCGYGPMVTGYSNPEVDAAALDQLKRGNCTTSAAPVMVELAEYLVDLIRRPTGPFSPKTGGTSPITPP